MLAPYTLPMPYLFLSSFNHKTAKPYNPKQVIKILMMAKTPILLDNLFSDLKIVKFLRKITRKFFLENIPEGYKERVSISNVLCTIFLFTKQSMTKSIPVQFFYCFSGFLQ